MEETSQQTHRSEETVVLLCSICQHPVARVQLNEHQEDAADLHILAFYERVPQVADQTIKLSWIGRTQLLTALPVHHGERIYLQKCKEGTRRRQHKL